MNGIRATKNRTIPRHNNIRPYDRANRREVLRYELSINLLADAPNIPIGSIGDLCDYIAVCHSYCTRQEAQSCSEFPIIYEEQKKLLEKSQES